MCVADACYISVLYAANICIVCAYWRCIIVRQLTQSFWVSRQVRCSCLPTFQQSIFWGKYLIYSVRFVMKVAFPTVVYSSSSSCISNLQGTVTKCILSDAGVYELDGRVRLYLTHCECLDMCRGVRCGSVMELHNMHVMKLSGTPWKVANLYHLNHYVYVKRVTQYL